MKKKTFVMSQLKRACTKPDDHIIYHAFRMLLYIF